MTTLPSCELPGGLFCVSLGSIILLPVHFTSIHLLWQIQIHALLHQQVDKKNLALDVSADKLARITNNIYVE